MKTVLDGKYFYIVDNKNEKLYQSGLLRRYTVVLKKLDFYFGTDNLRDVRAFAWKGKAA